MIQTDRNSAELILAFDVDNDNDSSSDGSGEDNNTKGSSNDSRSTSFASSSGQQHGKSSSGGGEDNDDAANIKEQLSKHETMKVDRLRYCVILLLLFSAASISAVTYVICQRSEQSSYSTQYDGASYKVIQAFQNIFDEIGIINTVGIAATNYGLLVNSMSANESNWPFMTIQNFPQTAASARLLSGSLYVAVVPMVIQEYRQKWEEYVVNYPQKSWIEEGLAFQEGEGVSGYEPNPPPLTEVLMMNMTRKPIFYYADDQNSTTKATMVIDNVTADDSLGYFPRWQTSPIIQTDQVNENLARQAGSGSFLLHTFEHGEAVFGNFEYGPVGGIDDDDPFTSRIATLLSIRSKNDTIYDGSPVVTLTLPIYDTFQASNRTRVGVLVTTIDLIYHLRNVLPSNIQDIRAVLKTTECDKNYTFDMDGGEVTSVGYEDAHDPHYDSTLRTSSILGQNQTIFDGSHQNIPFDIDLCRYYLEVYSSNEFESGYVTGLPIYVTVAVAFVFSFTILMFFVYNRLVEIRQTKILRKAAHTTAIVSSLFPKQVRDRMLQESEIRTSSVASNSKLGMMLNRKSFTSETQNGTDSMPIADLFPNCTVMFADVAGFTAWCSTRAPEHVFILLQTLYQSLDRIAKQRKVFKVETIGDCYLAVTGLPEPQENHAVIMARFAWECRNAIVVLTRDLEVTLGPDCGDLRMRFGLHSGPVTAGVLRGERARFQLFGDTVNTAARMESTGVRDKIQISESTAELLCGAGKSHWIKPREDKVQAKGKGSLTTFWLNPTSSKHPSSGTKSESNSDQQRSDVGSSLDDETHLRTTRLVRWVCEILLTHINNMVSYYHEGDSNSDGVIYHQPNPGQTCLDEVQEVIHMCPSKTIEEINRNSDTLSIDDTVKDQLFKFVYTIASMYRDNPFHNFEHACHVAMSSSKLLQRIVSPELGDEDIEKLKDNEQAINSYLHQLTYGIYSDPLAQFAIVFSALIHDVDHRGCSNARLMKEEPQLAARYRNQSTAEQNSFDLAWDLLMSDQFVKLRSVVFKTNSNLLRFRQIVLNSVLATDIFDKTLNDLRRSRWDKAFSDIVTDEDESYVLDRKATIVIEHIIQASDVAHTMQHWQIYQKWNGKLFGEMYSAYRAGRMDANPAEFWYQGEINFFDNYVIPLAKKLEYCGVFGVSSDEYLNYALNNRAEWEQRGKQIVEELVDSVVSEDSVH